MTEASSSPEDQAQQQRFEIYDQEREQDLNDWLKVYQHIDASSSSPSSSSHSSSAGEITTSSLLPKKMVPESVVLSRLMQNARTTLEMLSQEQKKEKRRKKPRRNEQITELQLLYNDTMALIRWLSQKINKQQKQQSFKCAL